MQGLFFQPYEADKKVTIDQLKSKFESMGAKTPKALLLARYLIEPRNGP